MTTRKPPAIATWLLDKLGYTRHNAALTGDLLEEFHSGRSGLWYWRQAAIVIAKGIRRNAFAAGTLGVAAVGFAVSTLVDCAFWSLHRHIHIDPAIFGMVNLLGAATLIGSWLRSRKVRIKGVGLFACWLAGWLTLLCFDAWCSSAPLTDQIFNNLQGAVFVWAALSLAALVNKEKTLQ